MSRSITQWCACVCVRVCDVLARKTLWNGLHHHKESDYNAEFLLNLMVCGHARVARLSGANHPHTANACTGLGLQLGGLGSGRPLVGPVSREVAAVEKALHWRPVLSSLKPELPFILIKF